jgi:hypothetical protein
MPLAERQRTFAAALMDARLPAPAGLIGPDGEPSARRFAVYRNNVVVGLVEALKAAFPAIDRIVGADFFKAMARAYVLREPPASPILLDYGVGFADFIGGFAPAAELPYLSDVARIERAWTEAFHAPEAQPLDPATLAAIAPDRLADLRLALHPSLRLLRSPYPALTIWRMNVDDGVPAPVDLAAGGEDALIARPLAEVEARSLPPGGFDFLHALSQGETVLAASRLAPRAEDRFDLTANLAGVLQAHVLVGFEFASETTAEGAVRLQ